MTTAATTSAVPARQAVQELISTYALLVDSGDFAGLGDLLADAVYVGGAEEVRGRDAVERMFRETLLVYADGTPRTRHVTTDVLVEVDEEAGTASARASFTAFQALPELPLQPIAVGRYHDRFARRDGRWRFIERRVHVDLAGDLRHHLRAASGAAGPR